MKETNESLEKLVAQRTLELARSEQEFRALAEAIVDWAWAVDENAVYTYVSPRVRAILGFEPAELIGKTPFDLMPPTEAQRVSKIFEPIVAAGKPFEMLENINLHKNGHEVVLETSAAPIFDEDGQLKGYRGIDRDITERKKEQEMSDTLNAINVAISSTLDYAQIMAEVLAVAAKAIDCEVATMAICDDKVWTIGHAYGLPKEWVGKSLSKKSAEAALVAAQSSAPFVSDDVSNDSRLDSQPLEELGVKSLLAVSLMARGSIQGALYFANRLSIKHFTSAQADFASKVASSISLAGENARLYSEQRNIADTLQTALITMPDSLPGIKMDCLYHSGTIAAQVGGDFYDLFEIEKGKIGVVIGDVSGKGVKAATLTSLVKNTIRAYVAQGDPPELTISKTNDVVCLSTDPEVFVTVFFGVLDTVENALVYCNAGHPLPLVRASDGSVFELQSTGTAIGVERSVTYESQGAMVQKGEVLLLFTDGVTEARRGLDFFGAERLKELFQDGETLSVLGLPGLIFERINSHCDGQLTDDVAILALSPQ